MAIFTIEASEREDFEKWLKEHDAKVRANAIDEVKEFLENKLMITDETIKGIEKLKEQSK